MLNAENTTPTISEGAIATAGAAQEKGTEGSRTPRPVGGAHRSRDARSVLECGCPLPLSLSIRERHFKSRQFPENLGRPDYVYAIFLLALALCGCAGPRAGTPPINRRFDFQKDSFAYPNELRWIYGYDANGKWVSHTREPKPTYWLRCFVVSRSARQFFLNAKFAPELPIADEATYKRLIKRVIATNPRRALPEAKKIVIPGYPDLHTFSRAQEKLLKAECGGQLNSYFQRGHWRMVMPFSRKGQERMAHQLVNHVNENQPVVAHVVRFPMLKINHVLLLFDAKEAESQIIFSAYDPNDPERPTTLTFDRASRTFLLPANEYFPGGRVDVYEVYHKWNY